MGACSIKDLSGYDILNRSENFFLHTLLAMDSFTSWLAAKGLDLSAYSLSILETANKGHGLFLTSQPQPTQPPSEAPTPQYLIMIPFELTLTAKHIRQYAAVVPNLG